MRHEQQDEDAAPRPSYNSMGKNSLPERGDIQRLTLYSASMFSTGTFPSKAWLAMRI